LVSLSETSARDALMELEGLRVRLDSVSSFAVLKQQQRQQKGHRRLDEANQAQNGRRGTATMKQVGQEKNDKKKSIGSTSSGKQIVDGSTASKQSTTTSKTKRKMQQQDSHPVWVRSKHSSTIALDTRATYRRANSSGETTATKKTSNNKPHRSVAATSSPNLVLQNEQHPTQQPATRNNRLSILSHSSGSTKLGEIPQHKWINPWVPPVEADDEEDDEQQEDERRARGSGLRFWRRFGRNGDRTST
jgi:hypothetical protein